MFRIPFLHSGTVRLEATARGVISVMVIVVVLSSCNGSSACLAISSELLFPPSAVVGPFKDDTS